MGLFNFKNSMNKDKDSEKLYASSRSFQPVGTKCTDGRYVVADELYDFIAHYFFELLESKDFKYLKSKKTFKRTTPNGCDEICIYFNDHVHYHANFLFHKRIDSLQKIITPVMFENGFNTGNNYREQYTVGITYKNISGQLIEIVSYSVLEQALAKVLKLIENEILPYFDKLNDINFVNQTFNYPEKDTKNPFSFFAKIGAEDDMITGIIIAKMLNDPNYDILLNKYMTRFPENIILKEKLIKVNEYLRQTKIS